MSKSYEKFIESIKVDNIQEVKSNFDIEYFSREDKYGLKPIHWACLTSNIDILEWMLQENCDIETTSINGWRPIHFASFIGNEEMVTFLFGKDYIKDCKTVYGETVLDVANGDCNHEFIDKILNENINLKIGLSMGLKCGRHCQHKFCLKSLIHCEPYKDYNVKKERNVIRVTDSYSNRQFAIRISLIKSYDEYEFANCIGPKLNEILPNIDHSKILKFYGTIKTETKIIVLREWMNNGTLRNKIDEKEALPFNNAKIYRYCKDILQAIAFLHGNRILHRFIDPANIFIDNHGGCKLGISDFGYSLENGDVKINDEWLSKHKKYSFAAPELVVNGILSYPYDIWLIGCTVIAMLTGRPKSFYFVKFDDIETKTREIPNQMLQSFVRSMVMRNPKERATANQLLNNEFMRNVFFQCMGPEINEIDEIIVGHERKNVIQVTDSYSNQKFVIRINEIHEYDEYENRKCIGPKINEILPNLDHSKIVKLYGLIKTETKMIFCTEWMSNGLLTNEITSFKRVDYAKIYRYCKDILQAIVFLHDNKILHRFVNPENILIDNNGGYKLQISNFSFSLVDGDVQIDEEWLRKYFKYSFAAPELVNKGIMSYPYDIWLFGYTVIEISTGNKLNYYSNKFEENEIIISKIFNEILRSFIRRMVIRNPIKRATTNELMNHEFMRRMSIMF